MTSKCPRCGYEHEISDAEVLSAAARINVARRKKIRGTFTHKTAVAAGRKGGLAKGGQTEAEIKPQL